MVGVSYTTTTPNPGVFSPYPYNLYGFSGVDCGAITSLGLLLVSCGILLSFSVMRILPMNITLFDFVGRREVCFKLQCVFDRLLSWQVGSIKSVPKELIMLRRNLTPVWVFPLVLITKYSSFRLHDNYSLRLRNILWYDQKSFFNCELYYFIK